jgi:hypothetical protein
MCCPGLRALPSKILVEGDMMGIDGVICFDSCWALICAPCGDGTCELHMGENFCSCPEDCLLPPLPLGCNDSPYECGVAYCRQEDDRCVSVTPRCDVNTCVWDEQEHPGQCNPVQRACQPRP